MKKQLKDAEGALDAAAYARYPKLTEADVKALVVDDKWLGCIEIDLRGEMDRVSQSLTVRIRALAERYDTRLPEISASVAALESKVEAHLKRMGFAW